MSIESPPPAPEPEPENGAPLDPFNQRHGVTTFTFDAHERLIEIHAPEERGGSTVYSHDPPAPLALEWKHLPDKRLYTLTAEGKTELWRDNPTRYLVVEPDGDSGLFKPALKRGRPVYLWLCREEREGR